MSENKILFYLIAGMFTSFLFIMAMCYCAMIEQQSYFYCYFAAI
jgi:hypothetical protein